MRSILGIFVLAGPLACALAGQEPKTNLRVNAAPFVYKGSFYLSLFVENMSDEVATIAGVGGPGWTPGASFSIVADGKELKFLPRGAYMNLGASGEKKEIAAKGRLFYGVAVLAGKDKAHLDDGYTIRTDLAPGEHEIEVHARTSSMVGVALPNLINKNVAPAKLKITIPVSLETAADQNLPRPKSPLVFTATSHLADSGITTITISVANESLDRSRYPYRGETSPWHRSNWYQLEVAGKIITPFRNEYEHKDGPGKQDIMPMLSRYAHTVKIVSDKCKDCKFDKNDYHPAYALPTGEHVVRVIPSKLWEERMLPVPEPATVRIRVSPPKK